MYVIWNASRTKHMGKYYSSLSTLRRNIHAAGCARRPSHIPLINYQNVYKVNASLQISHVHTSPKECFRHSIAQWSDKKCTERVAGSNMITIAPVMVEPAVQAQSSIYISSAFLKEVTDAKSPLDLLTLLRIEQNRAHVSNNPEVLKMFLQNLVVKQYTALGQEYPYKAWVKGDIDHAFSKINRANLNYSVAPILNGVFFQHFLLVCLQKNWNQWDTTMLVENLLSLLHLGMDKHEVILRKCYLKLRRNVDDTNWEDIRKILHASTVLGYKDFGLCSKILSRIKHDLSNGTIAERERWSFLQSANMCSTLFSSQICGLLTRELSRIFSDKEFITKSHNVTAWVTCASKLYTMVDAAEQLHLEKTFLQLSRLTVQLKGLFSVTEMGQIMRNMHTIYPSTAPPLFRNTDYADDKQACSSMDLQDLLTATAYCPFPDPVSRDPLGVVTSYPDSLRHCIEDLFLQQFRQLPDCGIHPGLIDNDVISVLLGKPDLNPDLQQLLKQVVLIGLLSGFYTDQSGAAIQIFEYTERVVLIDGLQKLITDCPTNATSCLLVSYGVANSESVIGQDFVSHLIKITPNCNILCSAILLRGLNAIPREWFTKHPDHLKQISLLYKLCYASVQNRLDNTSELCVASHSVFELGALLEQVLHNEQFCNVALGIQLMGDIEKRIQGQLTLQMEDYLARLCVESRYYAPDMIERLAHSAVTTVVESAEHVESRREAVLKLCTLFGHKPQCADELAAPLIQKYQHDRRDGKWRDCLQTLYRLSDMDVFPTEEIVYVFSEEGQREIKQYMEENGSEQEEVVNYLGLLNRTVLVNLPEFGDLWVAGTWGGKAFWREKYEGLPKYRRETDQKILKALEGLIPGKRSIMRRSRPRWGVVVDFEAAFDTESKPIPIGRKGFQYSGNEKKVAVMVGNSDATACNDPSIVLHHQRTQSRALKKFGYNIIHLSRDGWEANSANKIEVLKTAINNIHEVTPKVQTKRTGLKKAAFEVRLAERKAQQAEKREANKLADGENQSSENSDTQKSANRVIRKPAKRKIRQLSNTKNCQSENRETRQRTNRENRPYANRDNRHYGNRENREYANRENRPHRNGEMRQYGNRETRQHGNRENRSYANRENGQYANREKQQFGNSENRSFANGDSRQNSNLGKQQFGNRQNRQYVNRDNRQHANHETRQYGNRQNRQYENRETQQYGNRENRPGWGRGNNG